MLESLFNKVAGLKEHILKNRCKQFMLLKLYRCIGTIDERFGEISYDTVALVIMNPKIASPHPTKIPIPIYKQKRP